MARLAWVCAAALTVFVAWVATDESANLGIAFFYAVPVGLAAWWGGARWATVAVLGCVALYCIGAALQPVPSFGFTLALRVVLFAGVAAVVSFLRARLEALEGSARELSDLQKALTPPKLLELPDVDVAAAFAPSVHGDSGDFYLLTNGTDGSSVAIVGDVVGQGVDAVSLAMFVRSRFAALTAMTSDPAELLSLANAALIEHVGSGEGLVKAIGLRFRAEDALLSWAVAGHPPALRLPRLKELSPLGANLPLGIDPDLKLRTAHSSLDLGEGVIVYTDGATNVRRHGSQLGVEGLARLVKPMVLLPASGIASKAKEAVLDWADEPPRDDLCLLVLRPKRRAP
jgi:serine phosphatase RsbU (regulator of sigma subunit)